MNSSEKIKEYLSQNKELVKYWISDLDKQLEFNLNNEHAVFEPLIRDEYKELVYKKITEELVKTLNVTAEDVIIELEGIDIWGYLR